MARSFPAVLLALALLGAAPAAPPPIRAVRYAHDPDTVLIASAGVTAYDRTTGAPRWRLAPPPSGRTRAIAPLHHADAAVVGNDDGEVLLVDTRDGAVLRTLARAAAPAPPPASEAERIAAASGRPVSASAAPVSAFEAPVSPASWVLGTAVSPDDRLAVAVSLGGEARLWRLSDGERMPLPPGATGVRLEAATFTADAGALLLAGRFVGGENGEVLRVVDLERGTTRGVAMSEAAGCRHGQSVALAPAEDRVALACFGGALTMFAWPSLEPLWNARLSPSWAGPSAFERDGAHVIVMTAESTLRMDAATGDIRAQAKGGSGATNELAVHRDGTELLHGDRETGRLARRALPSLDLLSERVPGAADAGP